MLTLQLQLTVTYLPNGMGEVWLKNQLRAFAASAIDNAALTGESPAEVEAWNVNVVRIDKEGVK
jgi:hypothetical protein